MTCDVCKLDASIESAANLKDIEDPRINADARIELDADVRVDDMRINADRIGLETNVRLAGLADLASIKTRIDDIAGARPDFGAVRLALGARPVETPLTTLARSAASGAVPKRAFYGAGSLLNNVANVACTGALPKIAFGIAENRRNVLQELNTSLSAITVRQAVPRMSSLLKLDTGAGVLNGARPLSEQYGLSDIAKMSMVAYGLANNSTFAGWRPYEGILAHYRSTLTHYRSMADHLASYFDLARRLARDFADHTASQVTQPLSLLGVAALEALEAFDAGRHWIADAFLTRYLRLHPMPERREALWMILKKGFDRPLDAPPLWLTLDPQEQAVAYLRRAICNEAKRLKRDRELDDRLWWKAAEDWPMLAAEPDMLFADSFEEEPGIVVVRTLDDRKQILDELFVSGSSRDREIVRLIREGSYDRADIRNRVGNTRLLSFERKAQRWRKNRGPALGDG
jgi:hypothetical protein